jgi:hypothetical protein
VLRSDAAPLVLRRCVLRAGRAQAGARAAERGSAVGGG